MKDSNEDQPAPTLDMPFEREGLDLIPQEAIERWVSIPPNAPFAMTIPRFEMDRFYFLHLHLISAIRELQNSVIHASNGRTDDAQKSMRVSIDKLTSFQRNFAAFMSSVMTNSQEIKDG